MLSVEARASLQGGRAIAAALQQRAGFVTQTAPRYAASAVVGESRRGGRGWLWLLLIGGGGGSYYWYKKNNDTFPLPPWVVEKIPPSILEKLPIPHESTTTTMTLKSLLTPTPPAPPSLSEEYSKRLETLTSELGDLREKARDKFVDLRKKEIKNEIGIVRVAIEKLEGRLDDLKDSLKKN